MYTVNSIEKHISKYASRFESADDSITYLENIRSKIDNLILEYKYTRSYDHGPSSSQDERNYILHVIREIIAELTHEKETTIYSYYDMFDRSYNFHNKFLLYIDYYDNLKVTDIDSLPETYRVLANNVIDKYCLGSLEYIDVLYLHIFWVIWSKKSTVDFRDKIFINGCKEYITQEVDKLIREKCHMTKMTS